MEKDGISKEAAIEKIKDMDHRRRLWTQFLYDAEVIDPIFFDLVLNLERISIDDAIAMVVTEVKKEPFQPTEESLKALKDLHLDSICQPDQRIRYSVCPFGCRISQKRRS